MSIRDLAAPKSVTALDARYVNETDAAPLALAGQTPSQAPVAPTAAGAIGSQAFTARADHSHPSAGLFAWFGDGSDGAVTLDGTNTYSFLSKSGNVYKTTRPIFPSSLTINAGVTLIANSRVRVRDALVNNGTLSSGFIDGGLYAFASATTFSVVGAPSGAGYLPIPFGAQGVAGGTGNGAAGNGTASTTQQGLGGAGGAGGAGSTGTAGSAGSSGASTNGAFFAAMLKDPFIAHSLVLQMQDKSINVAFATYAMFTGGAGGGAGGGDGTNAGGNGGHGGGAVAAYARVLSGNGLFTAPGAAGGSPSVGNCGGGGGGGGGVVLVCTLDTSNWTGTLTAPGGAGGTKTGTGVNGAAGSVGVTVLNVYA